jgi:hypothetical protein
VRLFHQTHYLPLDQQRPKHQAWIDSLPLADRAHQNDWVLGTERRRLESERIHSLTEHAARRAGLRFTGIDPDTWEQDSQSREVRPSQSESLSHQMRDLSFDQLWARLLARIDSLPPAAQAHQIELVLDTERELLFQQTHYLPLDQQRPIHQAWIDSLPPAAQAHQIELVLDTERELLFQQTHYLPLDQQRPRHQAWIDSLPPAAQAHQIELVLGTERELLFHQTEDLPLDQQRPRHQAWIDSLLPADRAHQNDLVLDTERELLFQQTHYLPLNQQRPRHQAWIDSLLPADRAHQNDWVLVPERRRLFHQTEYLLLDQQRPIHQAWIDSLPQEHQAQQNEWVLSVERGRLLRQTEDLPFDQQRPIHQAWIDSLSQEHQAQQYQQVINEERDRLVDETRNLPFDQQRPIHQAWIDSLSQEHQAQQYQQVINEERDRLLRQTEDLPINQQQAIRQAWVNSLPPAYQAERNQNLLGEVDQQIQPVPQPDQIPHEQLNEPLLLIDEGSIQQELHHLLDEFRELQGLPPLDEWFHPIVDAIAMSSRISRDRLTEHQETVSRLVQRERELNLTPEEREQASLNFSRSLMQDLHLDEDSDVNLAWGLGIRLIEVTPTLESYNRIQDENLNREAAEQRTNAGQLLGRDLSQVSTEQYMTACSTVMLAMDERIENVYGRPSDGEDPLVMGHVRLMMEDVFMRSGRSERRDSVARQDPLLQQLQKEYLPRMFDNALRQAPYIRQIQDFERRQNSLSPDQQDRLRIMSIRQREVEEEMHNTYQEIEELLRNFKDKEERQ